MARLTFIVLLLTLSLVVRGQDDALSILQRANDAYSVGDYASAITLYEAVLNAGYRDAVVYFNLGNAYFERDDLGRALVSYRIAQHGMPRDADLNRNIALVRALRVDVQGDETALIDTLAVMTRDVLTLTELTGLVLVCWSLWFMLFTAWAVHPPVRLQLRLWVMLIGILTGLGLILLSGRGYVKASRPTAVVTSFQTEAMSGPGEAYVPLFTLHSAAEGRVLAQEGDWVRLLLPDGRQAWLHRDAITLAIS